MAIEKAKELIKAFRTDSKAQEALNGLAMPTDGSWIKYYAEAAKLLGYEVTEEDILGAITDTTKERAKKTEEAAAGIQALPDDELEQATGGGNVYYIPRHEDCSSTVGDYTQTVYCMNHFMQGYTCQQSDACIYRHYIYPNFVPLNT